MKTKKNCASIHGLVQQVADAPLFGGEMAIFAALEMAPYCLGYLDAMATTRIVAPMDIRGGEGFIELAVGTFLGKLSGCGYKTIAPDDTDTLEEIDERLASGALNAFVPIELREQDNLHIEVAKRNRQHGSAGQLFLTFDHGLPYIKHPNLFPISNALRQKGQSFSIDLDHQPFFDDKEFLFEALDDDCRGYLAQGQSIISDFHAIATSPGVHPQCLFEGYLRQLLAVDDYFIYTPQQVAVLLTTIDLLNRILPINCGPAQLSHYMRVIDASVSFQVAQETLDALAKAIPDLRRRIFESTSPL